MKHSVSIRLHHTATGVKFCWKSKGLFKLEIREHFPRFIEPTGTPEQDIKAGTVPTKLGLSGNYKKILSSEM
jgi:hypothetical protein